MIVPAMSTSAIAFESESADYLDFEELSEPRDNSVQIVVEEAKICENRTADPPPADLAVINRNAKPGRFTVESRTWPLTETGRRPRAEAPSIELTCRHD
jgi:hypothetical protein